MNKAAGAMSYDELRGAIAQRHRALSGRLQQIAEFVLDHPTDVALGTVAEVAQRSGVPPSAIVRFAHALGFGGFTEMQQVFRSRLGSLLLFVRLEYSFYLLCKVEYLIQTGKCR